MVDGVKRVSYNPKLHDPSANHSHVMKQAGEVNEINSVSSGTTALGATTSGSKMMVK